MSDSLKIETSSIPPPLLLCICCLQKEVPLISLQRCSHADFLNNLRIPEVKPNDQVVCYECHDMLKKIKQFTIQVGESWKVLSESTTENTSKRSNQKRNLTTRKMLNIDIPQTSNKDNTKSTDSIEKITEKKTKNIEEALKIINGNQNNENLNILASSLQSISQTLITDIYSEFQFNKSNLISTESGIITPSSSTNITTALSTGVENAEKVFDKKEWYQKMTEKDFFINVSESNMEMDNLDAPYGDYSNLKQLRLTKEELMQERAKLASSPGYLRSRHRCKSCLIGFQYKENLADHVKRKHTTKNKKSLLKCKVCRQLVRRDVYEAHTFWHYNRYKCLSCGQQFGSYDTAVLHYTKQHNNITSGNTELKCPQCSYKTFRNRRFRNHLLTCKAELSYASRRMLQINILTEPFLKNII